MTNVHDWSNLRSLWSPNLGIAFSSRKKSIWTLQIENDYHEPQVWVSSIFVKKKEDLLNAKVKFRRAVV